MKNTLIIAVLVLAFNTGNANDSIKVETFIKYEVSVYNYRGVKEDFKLTTDYPVIVLAIPDSKNRILIEFEFEEEKKQGFVVKYAIPKERWGDAPKVEVEADIPSVGRYPEVNVGMSKSKVFSIMGYGSQSTMTTTGKDTFETLNYIGSSMETYIITFHNDKVYSKEVVSF